MTIWLASFRGNHKNLVNRLGSEFIRLMCKGVYSHNEIVIGESPFEDECRCISSSSIEGGVREKRMQLNQADWDVIRVDADIERIEWWIGIYDGHPFDYFGTVAVRLPFLVREHPTKFFCSEACGDMLGLDEPWRLDPCGLHAVAGSFLEIHESS